jgi:carboxyl-terminal processing protease
MKANPSARRISNQMVFQDLWYILDQHYGLFGVKAVDWDALRETYTKRVTEADTDTELFDLFAELLSHLQDKHVWLISSDRVWNCRMEASCSLADIDRITAAWKAPFSESLVFSKYLHDKTVYSKEIVGGFLDPTVAYLRISAFSDDTQAVSEAIDQALQTMGGVKTLVVDVRDNRGGSDRGGKAVADRFADRRRLFMTAASRSGGSREELGPPFEWWIEPNGPRQFLKPVVLLINRDTFSAAETFTLAMRVLPNVTIVGEPTAGVFSDTHDLTLSNGWQLTYSIGEWRDAQGNLWEGRGFPPDVVVPLPKDRNVNKCDPVLDLVLDSLFSDRYLM